MWGAGSPRTRPWGARGLLSAQWRVGTQQGSASPSQVCVWWGVLAGAHASSKQGSGLEGEPGASPALSSALLLFCARQARPWGASEGRSGLWAVFPPNTCGSHAGPWHRWDV